MGNLSYRNFRCNLELYQDAVLLTANEWIEKYNIHRDLMPAIDHYTIKPDGSHPFALDSKAPAKLRQAFVRLFLLGIQVASEEKGNGGRSPTTALHIEANGVRRPSGQCDDYAVGTIAETGDILMTKKYIERIFECDSGKDMGHTKRDLNPLQWALLVGIEEGLHAESYRIPGNREKFMAAATVGTTRAEDYKIDPSEVYIHNDLVRIANKINPTYDAIEWPLFLLTYNKALPAPSRLLATPKI